jgi:hypothetical protein
LIHRRPSPPERLELLDLYEMAVTRAEQRSWRDPGELRRLGYQRAADSLAFLLAEFRDHGASFADGKAAASLVREVGAGRLRVDGLFLELVTWLLGELDARPDPSRPGVHEVAAIVSPPPDLSPPHASSPSQPSP